MTNNITTLLKKLGIKDTGKYDNHFYVIQLADSDDYARYYTKLDELAINQEDPGFGTNTNNTTIKVTNYFEIEVDNVKYQLFLIANFNDDTYYLKIKEQN